MSLVADKHSIILLNNTVRDAIALELIFVLNICRDLPIQIQKTVWKSFFKILLALAECCKDLYNGFIK